MSAPRPHTPLAPPLLALIGLRCSGKSTLASLLAQRLGLSWLDLDEQLAPGQSAGALLRSLGESRFRDLEQRALERVLAHARALTGPRPTLVLATGGGVVERATNCALLAREALCIWLHAPIEVLQARLRASEADAAGELATHTSRPALLGQDAALELPELARRREPAYESLARLRLDTHALSPAACADELVSWLATELASPSLRSPPHGDGPVRPGP